MENTAELLKNLNPDEINFVEKYTELFHRITNLQTRMTLVETDLQNALKELEQLRELEKQYKQNG